MSSRRRFLTRAGSGLGGLALLQLLDSSAAAAGLSKNPLIGKVPHHTPKAKSVIWLFMEGGPSHLDLFDPKPALEKLSGQPMPESFGKPITAMGTSSNTIMPSRRKWARHGQSGLWVSDWYPEIARHADDLAVIRSCWADGLNHVGSVCQMNTGAIIAGRPSLGAWLTYGLGTANENLPVFVILTDNKSVVGGAQNWSSGFLPATYQGTLLQREGPPILHLERPEKIGDTQQRGMLDLLLDLNRHHAEARPNENELDARMESYELAYRMQTSAPEAVDLSRESEATKKLYGMDDPVTRAFGTNCLMARRLVERGVR
ncbi:MAG TPA: DUF1501 domain-containing protein, partial [Bryobacteraceae bacterium]|nr:DUF1501 domain-containing protein [Bryobacteraceae bacterium]